MLKRLQQSRVFPIVLYGALTIYVFALMVGAIYVLYLETSDPKFIEQVSLLLSGCTEGNFSTGCVNTIMLRWPMYLAAFVNLYFIQTQACPTAIIALLLLAMSVGGSWLTRDACRSRNIAMQYDALDIQEIAEVPTNAPH